MQEMGWLNTEVRREKNGYIFFTLCVLSSDASSVTLLRYEDPEADWRKIPDMTKIMDGKVEIEPNQAFHVDTAAGKVSIFVKGSNVDVGTRMLYMLRD